MGRLSTHVLDTVAGRAYRQKLRLRPAPTRHEQVGERRARRDHVAGRATINALHEPARARLHDGDVARVEIDDAGCVDRLREVSALHARQTNAEVLQQWGIDSLRVRAVARMGFQQQRRTKLA